MLDEINIKYVRCERNPYFTDSALLPGTLENMRIFALKDPRWYLRQDISNDCSLSGGYCDLKCGCCEKHAGHMDLKGINGHCTWACRCCIETSVQFQIL